MCAIPGSTLTYDATISMVARDSQDSGPGEYAREKALKTASAILKGELGIIEGARVLSTLAPDLVADWKVDPDLLVLAALDSETDDLPLGKQRELWATTALAERDAIVLQMETDARQNVEAACRNILRRFNAD
jgi:Protein of unknown function (DUF2489)